MNWVLMMGSALYQRGAYFLLLYMQDPEGWHKAAMVVLVQAGARSIVHCRAGFRRAPYGAKSMV